MSVKRMISYKIDKLARNRLAPVLCLKTYELEQKIPAAQTELKARLSQLLPEEVQLALRAMAAGKTAPVIHIQGLPVESDLAETPLCGTHKPGQARAAVNAIFLVQAMMNLTPYAYIGENEGRLVRAVVPVSGKENIQGSHGSKAMLSAHTDGAFLKFPKEQRSEVAPAPDFLFMFCNRGDARAKTSFLNVDEILTRLDPATKQALYKPEFAIQSPESFRVQPATTPVSILRDHPEFGPQIRYYQSRTRGLTAAAMQAITTLDNLIESVGMEEVCLSPGDLVIISNLKSIHARTSFAANFNGQDRWVTRIYGARESTTMEARPYYLNGNPHVWIDHELSLTEEWLRKAV